MLIGTLDKWADSLNKLLVFDKRHWQRILMIDSDATLLKSMDELFFMPSQPAILPKAYWHWPRKLASHIMLIEPSREENERVRKAIDKAPYGVYDMEIMNDLYGRKEDCVVLPHRKYALLSGEFRAKNHDAYLGKGVKWDAKQVWDEAKIVHFSDHPLKKPWEAQWEDVKDYQPDCEDDGNCVARDIWLTLYSDYWKKAKVCCALSLRIADADLIRISAGSNMAAFQLNSELDRGEPGKVARTFLSVVRQSQRTVYMCSLSRHVEVFSHSSSSVAESQSAMLLLIKTFES